MVSRRGQRARPRNGNQSNNQKSNKSSQKSNGSNGRSRYNSKGSEFRFQLQDSTNKKTYTFEKIRDAIILRIQTQFQSGRYIVTSLRDGVKKGPPMPTRETSNKADADEKRIEQETMNRKYEAKLIHYFRQNEDFEDNWIKAYGLIYATYCSREMQTAIRESQNYESTILDNPLELLTEVEKLMHVPRKAVYPTLALIETISSLLSLRQGPNDTLMTYLEKFKSERNVVINLFGKRILDEHVENTKDYQDIPDVDTTIQAQQQKAMKTEALEKFWSLLFLKQADQSKYGHLLKEFRQSYANGQRDLYPVDLASMFEVMRTVNVKQKSKQPKKNNDEKKDEQSTDPQQGAESFAQQGDAEIRCFCCGKEGELSTDCPLKDKIPRKEWFNKTGTKHYLKKQVNTQVASGSMGEETKATKVGFVFTQVAKLEKEEPEILLDSGSTISLFKDQQFLTERKPAKRELVMETNAGNKIINTKGNIPGYGDVWYDETAISNLFSLSDMVEKGVRVVYDSQVADEFVVHTKEGHTIRFPVDERGLYVKEKFDDLQTRLKNEKDARGNDDEETPAITLHIKVEESDDESEDDLPTLVKVEESDDESEDDEPSLEMKKQVHTTVEGFTEREVMRAKRCRKLLHDLSAPSYNDLKALLRQNIVKNCPVSFEDVDLATRIFGKDSSIIKGKDTRPRPPVVTKEDMLDLPDELKITETELAVDVMFVEDQAFVHSLDRKIKGGCLVPLGTMRKATSKQLLNALKKIIRFYNKADIRINLIHTDNEFKEIEELVDEKWSIDFNFSAPDEHVGDIERSNRTLGERYRAEYHRLPYKLIPRQMIRGLMSRCAFNRDLFIKKGGCSKYYSPYNILKRRSVDYKKHLLYSFGEYVIASHEAKPKNNPKPRGIDAIYIRPAKSLQGGHEVMDLGSGRVVTRPKVTPMKMTDLVMKRVEDMAKRQGLKSMKFYNRKRQEIIFTPNDLLEGVGNTGENAEILEEDDIEHGNNLPDDDEEIPELLMEDDVDLEVDEEVDENELADLLDDVKRHEDSERVEETKQPDEESLDGDGELDDNPNENEDEDEDVASMCEPGIGDEEDMIDNPILEPDLVSEEDGEVRPTRNRIAPTRYNPDTGRNYLQQPKKYCTAVSFGRNIVPKMKGSGDMQFKKDFACGYVNYLKGKEICHNILAQVESDEDTLTYSEEEARVLACYITYAQVNNQFILPKAIKRYGNEGVKAAKEEIGQLHNRTCFRAMAVSELTRQEKARAMEGLMFVTQKRTGEYKGRLAYNGKPTREWVTKEDKTSPTCFTESILLSCGIDALERRDIMTLDIPNAFVQTDMPRKKVGERIVMKIRGRLVDWLVEMDPLMYKDKVVYENGVKVIYLEVLKAIYGMLIASLLWYRKFRTELESIGFVFNKYDPCVANRVVNKQQQTIRMHVDDLLISCKDKKANDQLHNWCNQKYGKLKKVRCKRGGKHTFLGMLLDFESEPGAVHVRQDEYIEDIVSTMPENLKGNSPTPASNDLFRKGAGELLSEDKKELFHTIVAKGLFVAKRSRPDIGLPVSVLSGRVRTPNKDDWRKLRRMVDYLKGSKDLHLKLKLDNGFSIAKWYIDASFATHEDFRSHTGGVLKMGNSGGGLINTSIRQKLNTRSSTEAELVGVDDCISKVLWTSKFLKGQGLPPTQNIILQDNKSAIILETKGNASAGKRMRHLDVRYFFVKDLVERGELSVEHCRTEMMLADFHTKPLQGKSFLKFRAAILGC